MAALATGNVLVTSASKKVPLIRAMQKAARRLDPAAEVIAGDVDPNALTRCVADMFWQMPRTVDENVDVIRDGCLERKIHTILPTRDGELPFWAHHRAEFAKAGIDVIISPAESIALCLDKLAFAKFGAANALPIIPAAVHPDDVTATRFVVKERHGAGSRFIGLDLDRDGALDHGASLAEPIYQPFIAGQEISVDAWMDQTHGIKGLVLRRRDTVVNGESQVTTTFSNSEIEATARKVLQSLKLRGPVVMQMIIDQSGAPHVIECNTRFGGASTASIEAGLDAFYWSLIEGWGGDVSSCAFDRILGEVRQVRVAEDILVHQPRNSIVMTPPACHT